MKRVTDTRQTKLEQPIPTSIPTPTPGQRPITRQQKSLPGEPLVGIISVVFFFLMSIPVFGIGYTYRRELFAVFVDPMNLE